MTNLFDMSKKENNEILYTMKRVALFEIKQTRPRLSVFFYYVIIKHSLIDKYLPTFPNNIKSPFKFYESCVCEM